MDRDVPPMDDYISWWPRTDGCTRNYQKKERMWRDILRLFFVLNIESKHIGMSVYLGAGESAHPSSLRPPPIWNRSDHLAPFLAPCCDVECEITHRLISKAEISSDLLGTLMSILYITLFGTPWWWADQHLKTSWHRRSRVESNSMLCSYRSRTTSIAELPHCSRGC